MAQVDPLSSSLEIAGAFSNTGVPVEIVEAENQSVEAVLSSNNNGRQTKGGVADNPPNVVGGEEAMDISVEGDQNLDSTQLSSVPKSVEVPVPRLPTDASSNTSAMVGNTVGRLTSVFDAPVAITSGASGVSSVSTNTSSIATQVAGESHQSTVNGGKQQQQQQSVSGVSVTAGSSQTPLSSLSARQSTASGGGEGETAVNHLRATSAIEQLSQSLGASHQALEISADAISALPDNLGHLGPQEIGSGGVVDRAREMFGTSMNFSGLDISGASAINTSSVLDPESPSSPESNFDSSDLLNSSLLQQDEVTQRLAQSGPIGVAAAAAIMSSRKRKRSMTFETNPSLRKRHCSKLSKRLKETIDELSMRVGLQAVVVMYKPGKTNIPSSDGMKNDPSFKVFGAAPLSNVVKNLKDNIITEMDAALHQQAPPTSNPTPKTQSSGEMLHDLPPLVFDGIPTPVHKMTQAQLRTFIPNMLKFATGRGKPGWGKDDVKPVWWPTDVPWANVRSDIRTDEQKKKLPWTDALRRIVISCYVHYGRIDLLPEFSIEQLQQIFSPESTQQLQLQLESLQQQQEQQQQQANAAGSIISDESAENVTVSNTLSDVTTATSGSGEPVSQDLLATDNQQVFTVDTGMGTCDTTGMPTLADASLAETAARLQQVADETGEVQYATQTVTVTERDAKALGQPVGSTTTVLLTAYPGGHSGAVGGEASAATQPASEQLLATTQQQQQGSTSTNVQVVYSASHMESISDSIGTSIPSSVPATAETFSSTLAVSSGVVGEVSGVTSTMSSVLSTMASTTPIPTIADVVGSEYLNPTAGQEMMMSGATDGGGGGNNTGSGGSIGGVNEGENPADLAAQLINQYTSGDGSESVPFDMKVTESKAVESSQLLPATTTPQVPSTTEN